MKQLTCEMCGSTDLMKQDGVFVCQGCGCKYSVEEAKRMMAEDGDAVAPVAPAAPANNSAQIDNLLNLAQSSYDSKNYAQAEAFCNQIIALDSLHYQAWKLKGQAINFQISATNQRILEAYNCIMTAYKVLPDEVKPIRARGELLGILKEFFEGEMYFWLNQFESARPTDAALTRAKNAYVDGYNKLSAAFDEFGLPSEEKLAYMIHFDNLFIIKCNTICTSAWKTTVGYNYYRDYMDKSYSNVDPFGRSDQRWIIKDTDLYRPMKNTWDTFLQEADNLIALLQFAEEQINDETPVDTVEALCNNIVYIEERVIPSGSWHITQGYTSNWDEYKSVGWHEEYNLTDNAKKVRRTTISKYTAKAKLFVETAKKRQRDKEEAEKKARVDKYWSEHAEEKAKLEQELADLTKRLEELKTQISAIEKRNAPKLAELHKQLTAKLPAEDDVEKQREVIAELMLDRSRSGLFAFKKKKEIQERIDTVETPKLEALRKTAEDAKKAHLEKVNDEIKTLQEEGADLRKEEEKIRKRVDKIKKELTKDRP